MGMFQVKVKVASPAHPEKHFEEVFWVDTGALYTFIPEDRLASIELKPLRAREVILADGRRDRRMLGEALLSIAELGETLTCPVLFAPVGSLYLLGATALENFGVEADPTERRLKPIAAVIGGHLASRSLEAMQKELSQTEEITEIIQFIEQSERGIIR
jgi:predicted aspartyl protease